MMHGSSRKSKFLKIEDLAQDMNQKRFSI